MTYCVDLEIYFKKKDSQKPCQSPKKRFHANYTKQTSLIMLAFPISSFTFQFYIFHYVASKFLVKAPAETYWFLIEFSAVFMCSHFFFFEVSRLQYQIIFIELFCNWRNFIGQFYNEHSIRKYLLLIINYYIAYEY